MEQNKKFKLVSSKKTRYLLPNILTLGGVCLGISSIKFSIDGNFSLAVTLILFASILDALDGRIARLIKGTSEFGKELDSLTDFVSFGIAPVFVLYFWELNTYGKLGWAIALIFSVCCVLRLARFNLTKIDNDQEWKSNFFEGVPSPAGGLLILMPLNRNFSIDSILWPKLKQYSVSSVWIWIIRFQMSIVYFYGGLAKFDPDWLNGMAPKALIKIGAYDTPIFSLIRL